MRTKIEHRVKVAFDILDPVEQAVANLRMQEVDAAGARRAIAMRPPRVAIEQQSRNSL